MPLADGGDLLEFNRSNSPIDEVTAAQIMYSAFTAIDHLHSMGIFHRDIKPENFLFMDDNLEYIKLVLCDLGFAKHYSPGEKESTEFFGTPYYCAPEILLRRPCMYFSLCKRLSNSSMINLLIFGRLVPLCLWFFRARVHFLYPILIVLREVEILNAQYGFDSAVWDNVSEEAKDLIQQMIRINPERACHSKTSFTASLIQEIHWTLISRLHTRTPHCP